MWIGAGGYIRPKTPAPMMRIEDIGAGSWFEEGGGAAMARVMEVVDTCGEEERKGNYI